MTCIKYVHVLEYEDGDRIVASGKGERSGVHVAVPTPDNDREEFERREWERVGYWELPEPMSKSEFEDWLKHEGDADPVRDFILDAVQGGDPQ